MIWVVVDLFSKRAHFIPCTSIPTAKKLAKLFLQHVYRLHGAPKRIISDRGPQFTSKFWKQFTTLIGSTQALSSSFHPQTDGSTEILNSLLEQYLRCFTNHQQDNWSELLPFAEVAYNNTIHQSTGFTPYKVATGQDFLPFPELPTKQDTGFTPDQWITNLTQLWPQISSALQHAREQHKKFADRKRTENPPWRWEIKYGYPQRT